MSTLNETIAPKGDAAASGSDDSTKLDPFGTAAPSDTDLQALQQRLLSAVNKIRATGSTEQNQMLDYLLNQAHDQTADLVSGDTNSSPVHHILANVKSLLMHAQVIPTSTGGLAVTTVSDEGDLVGKNPYESLDIGWTESAVCWLEHFPPETKANFRTSPPEIPLEEYPVSIAIAGDWGTGFTYRTDGLPTPAEKVADQIKALIPTYAVHLGDVYYAGTETEEQLKFIGNWPPGERGGFTLNSNHEMYSGANGYYSILDDVGRKFAVQNGNSYFALSNKDWLVIGLDTAYHADEIHLYQHGYLDPAQCAFIDGLITRDAAPKRAILLTHHNGLSVDGMTPSALWGQVASRFAGVELWWYWGHMHAGIVYSDRDTRGQMQPSSSGGGIIHARCAGHGAVPAGEPDSLVANPGAVWHENRTVADLLYPGRVYNGLVSLTLNGADLTEEFIDEDGAKAYTRTFLAT
ncbi:hypothetical protein SAMN05414139_10876 [Burkholderia sp. D7]|nr:hypothetical protein SAMN05414139_10876 [Burkholderia sp. D7]